MIRVSKAALLLMLTLAVPAAAQDDRIDELERKVDVLTQEIEGLRLGVAADTSASLSRYGFAPAASKVYGVTRGVTIGGYGELLLEKFDREREDDAPSNRIPQLDYLRNILYVGFKFDDRLLFNSEIELEHAVVGEGQGGEITLEFAYLDYLWRPAFGLRAGMLLVPIGLVNEWHEPPVFIGTRRPDVEQRIIPTTWRANGAGIFGQLPSGFAYRAYLTEGLDATGFTAGSALRDGRQSGSRSKLTHPAVSGRLDYEGLAGLLIGVSGYRGDSWQDAQPADTLLSPRTTLFDVHARVQYLGLEARALAVFGQLEDAADLSDHLGLAGQSRLGGRFHGHYVEAAYDVAPLLRPGASWALLPYARFERYDTQEDVSGGPENPANERTTITAGLGVKPHPNVILKLDRQSRRNVAETETSQWNVQLGYLY
ncbi:MAG TPA: hypothetical protein VEY91_02725 [Candidatus Limnocylindria bacterium]|nr:hypothetical protein [Candidatus Limnocylindria bacterium]